MSITDPISNLLTVIRNATMVQKETVDIPASKLSANILEIFKNDGYIENYRELKDTAQGTLKIYLKYDAENPIIRGLKKISRPGYRVYVNHNNIPRVLNGLGTAIISTSKGVISDKDARKLKIGGEVLCHIW